MSDIFISYARENREQAKTLAEALGKLGWSVWWDRIIPAGQPFDEVIERELSDAKCVLVIWSSNSVSSHWVCAEAQEGLDRKILIPVQIEDVKIPLGFRNIQTINLTNWNGNSAVTTFQDLIRDINNLLGPSPKTQKGWEDRTTIKTSRKNPFLLEVPELTPKEDLNKPIASKLSESSKSAVNDLLKVFNNATSSLQSRLDLPHLTFTEYFESNLNEWKSNLRNYPYRKDVVEESLNKCSGIVDEKIIENIRLNYQELKKDYFIEGASESFKSKALKAIDLWRSLILIDRPFEMTVIKDIR